MLLMVLRRLAIVTLVQGAVLLPVYAQTSSQAPRKPLPSDPVPRTQSEESQTGKGQSPSKTPPENDDGVSSSRDQIIDLSPPSNDLKNHPDSEVPSDTGDIQEFHTFDPHKAAKAVEIGDFYFKRRNYAAAVSRYREALLFKPSDAIATFRLAQALEQSRNFAEARKEYQSYLKILPYGPSAAEARKALERLPKTLLPSASSGQ